MNPHIETLKKELKRKECNLGVYRRNPETFQSSIPNAEQVVTALTAAIADMERMEIIKEALRDLKDGKLKCGSCMLVVNALATDMKFTDEELSTAVNMIQKAMKGGER